MPYLEQQSLPAPAAAHVYHNPIVFADLSDPDAIRVGNDYYCVTSSLNYLPGLPLFHSPDLIHWEQIGNCVARLPFPRYDQPQHGAGIWAPAIRYHDREYLIFVPLPDEGLFVTRAADPYGRWSELTCLKAGAGLIDPCPFWDDDGRAYLVYAYANSRCGRKNQLALCEMSPDGTRLLSAPQIIFDGVQTNPTLEGPKLYKRNGYYYIFAPAGGVEQGWQTVLRARRLTGPYEYRIVLHQGDTEVNGPHQGSYLETTAGEPYFLHFQDRGPYGRVLHLQPVEWINDWPFIGQDQNGDMIGEPVRLWPRPQMPPDTAGPNAAPAPVPALQMDDEFDQPALGWQWQWPANPRSDAHSLTARPGWLRLRTLSTPDGPQNSLWNALNTCTTRLTLAAGTIQVRLTLQAEQVGDLAGVGFLGHEYSYLGLEATAAGRRLVLRRGTVTEPTGNGRATEQILWQQTLPGAPESPAPTLTVTLTLTAAARYTYRCAVDDRPAVRVPYEGKLCRGTWVGARLALAALNTRNRPSAGLADFAYVRTTKHRRS